MLIKELMKYGRAVSLRLKETDNPDEAAYLKVQSKALNMLLRYIYDGDWARKSTREKLKAFILNKFDYKYVCKTFNTSRESFDVFLCRQDKRLSGIIGKPFELICKGEIEEGVRLFSSATGAVSIKREIWYNTAEILPEAKIKEGLSLGECSKEIEFLTSISKIKLRERLSECDTEKLSHLLYLVSAKEDEYRTQKRELVHKIL